MTPLESPASRTAAGTAGATLAGTAGNAAAVGSPATALERKSLRRWRWPLTVTAVLIVGSVTTAMMLGTRSNAGTLDPESASADGGRALATLLGAHGIAVSTVRSTADAVAAVQRGGPDSTLLVTDPFLLTPSQLDTLAGQHPGRLVLLESDSAATDALATGVVAIPSPSGAGTRLAPGCSDPDVSAAGSADLGDGTSYLPLNSSVTADCYPMGSRFDGFALVAASGPASADTVLVGSRTPFRNDKLATGGNAALALRILGKHAAIVWYLPDTADPAAASAGGPKGLSDVIPAGWKWAFLELALAALLLAAWQARRLGPVVVERLPVVVRAAETVEGRARLYERGRVHDGAASALREATRSRMAARLGLPRTASPSDVAAGLSARGGRPAVETVALLAGAPPSTDEQLVRLAGELDALEAEVGRL